MASYKPNDWAEVIKAQSDFHFKQLLEEKSLETLNKELYKSELERQLKQKELQKSQEKQESNSENQKMTQKIQDYQAEQQKMREDKKNLQNYLSFEYSSHIQNKNSSNKEEAVRNLKEDQQILSNAKAQLENFIEFKRNMKLQKTVEEQQFLRSKSKEKEMMVKEKEIEKKVEKELVVENMERGKQREIEILNNLKKVDQKRTERVKVYEPVVNEKYRKEAEKESAISNWEKERQERLKDEELNRLMMKLENKRRLVDGLNSQLKEKNHRKDLAMKDYNAEKKKMDQVLQNYKFNVEQSKINQLKSQKDYFEILRLQKLDFDLRRMSQNTMSPKERGVNQDILKKIEKNEEIEFRGVPGYHPRISPLQSSFSRAYKNVSDNINLSKVRSSSQAMENYQTFDSQKSGKLSNLDLGSHNPITNPVGYQSPYLSYRGREVHSLDSANIFKYK